MITKLQQKIDVSPAENQAELPQSFSSDNNSWTDSNYFSFDSNTHDWDSNEWIEVNKRRNKRRKVKELSYSDIFKKPIRQLDIPKISKGEEIGKKNPASLILLLEPSEKGCKMQNSTFLEKKIQNQVTG